MRHLICALLVLGLTPLLALEAGADPNAPVTATLQLDPNGQAFPTGLRTVDDLSQPYIEEEYFISGRSSVYNYTSDPGVRGDIEVIDPNVPYTTRIVIRRPADPNAFNGTVIFEWWNSTASFDTAPSWDPSAEYIGRKGIVYVGVTTSATAINFLVNGCNFLGITPPCGTRYASLSILENGQAYEMVSQIAHLLKSSSSENPLFPDYPVERIFHAGQSQQGGSIVTYASAFHFSSNDGYFVQAAGSARDINSGIECDAGDPNVPAFPDCTPELTGAGRRVDPNLPVPVYRAQTGTDMAGVLAGGSRQTDTELFRYYETTGTAHNTVHKGTALLPGGIFTPPGDPIFLAELCSLPQNTLADGPIFGSYLYNAMWENMELQVRFGTPPPSGELIETEEDPNDPNGPDRVALDSDGNALGGIRLPQLDVPIATYGPRNVVDPNLPFILTQIGNLVCNLSATAIPFGQATLDTLYPDWTVFVNDFNARIDDPNTGLIAQRFLLEADAAKLRLHLEDKDQQKCIVDANKNFAKVAKAQGKDIGKCIKDATKSKLVGQNIEQCTVADGKGKVDKAKLKTRAKFADKCGTTPDFGSTDPNSSIAAAIAKELDLVHSIFGSDLDSAVVVIDKESDKDPNDPTNTKAEAKCQVEVAKLAAKCQKTKLKIFGKCKKAGLKESSVHDRLTLASCIGDDPDGKILKACVTKLGEKIEKKCNKPGAEVDYAAVFPGDCSAAATLDDFKICIDVRVECQVCLGLNAADALGFDCDEFDDGELNASCP